MIEEGMGLGLPAEMTLRAGLLQKQQTDRPTFRRTRPQSAASLSLRANPRHASKPSICWETASWREHRAAHAAKLGARKRRVKGSSDTDRKVLITEVQAIGLNGFPR